MTDAFPRPEPGPALERGTVLTPRFDAAGLICAVTTHADTGEVLMVAWMNAEALRLTLETGAAHYYSRSRQSLWKKGETSGQSQHLVDLRLDCDGDTLLALVRQDGVACHTGRRTCFYLGWRDGTLAELSQPEIAPEALYRA